jgi:hypothetical protein
VALERGPDLRGGERRIAVGPARRLGDDLVADAEVDQVGRGQLELGRGVGDLARVAPQDGRAAFGR